MSHLFLVNKVISGFVFQLPTLGCKQALKIACSFMLKSICIRACATLSNLIFG